MTALRNVKKWLQEKLPAANGQSSMTLSGKIAYTRLKESAFPAKGHNKTGGGYTVAFFAPP